MLATARTPASDVVQLVPDTTIAAMLERARETPRTGCFVEVGVYQGGSARYLHSLAFEQRRLLYLYDTFEGMPYYQDGDAHPLGDFSQTSYEAVRALCPYASVTKGVFPGSAREMPPIAFAHLDVDNYRCVRECGEYLADRMMDGGVLWIDDSPYLDAAHKAARELFGDALQLSSTGQNFVQF